MISIRFLVHTPHQTQPPGPQPVTPMRTILSIICTALLPASVTLAGGGGDGGEYIGGDHLGCECCLAGRLEAARWSQNERARPVPGFDAKTGRNLLNYPPDRHVQYHHMRLDIDIPDMSTPRFDARQTLTVTPIARPLEALTLNAALLDIQTVSAAQSTASFEHDGAKLHIFFDPPIPAGIQTQIITTYTVNDPPFGLIWTLPSPAWPGRAAQIHTQGQPEDNRYWFPMHDFPNVRLTTELLVTAPAGFQVISNGRMVSGGSLHQAEGQRANRTPTAPPSSQTWHWIQEQPHVTYLVSLVVGKFDVVDVAASARSPLRGERAPSIAMPVYVPPGRASDVHGTYGRTPRMMELFARLIDEPYPWHQYAQTVVWNFGPGGMENTGATTMHDHAILTPRALTDADIEGLISHELAHQWFGNLITCNSWEHIWLNEGFATYFTNLWWEERDGIDGYFDGVIGNFDRVINVDRANSPYQPAMASKAYDDPWDVFRRAANPYPKGAAILHMLRHKLGDEVFFRSLAVYVDRHRNTSAETSDLRTAMEDVSGENLEQFFQQWVFRPGVPHLDITLDWDRTASELVVNVTQSQNIDGYNPAFEFTLPIWVRIPGATPREDQTATIHLDVRGRQATGRYPFTAEPSIVAVDPHMTVLARTSIRQPVRRWLAQFEHGPSLFARTRAARALSTRDTAVVGPILLREAMNTRNHHRLRAEAARALGRGGHTPLLIELAEARRPILENSEVRLAMVEAIARAAASDEVQPRHASRLKELLIHHAGPDEPSERARAAAITGLGQIGATDQIRVIIAAADSPSQRDRVRQAALAALGQLGQPEGLPVAIRYALPGTLNRTRPVAIRSVVQLAEHDRESSLKMLRMAAKDRERRAWEAAGEALVELGDPRAIEHLEMVLESKRDERDRRRVQGWIQQLQEQAQPAEAR